MRCGVWGCGKCVLGVGRRCGCGGFFFSKARPGPETMGGQCG